MKKKKHKHLESIQTTERAQEYFTLWERLNKSHEESEIDAVRRLMAAVWKKLEDSDKISFHQRIKQK